MYIDKTIAFFKCTDQLQSNENNKNTNERKKIVSFLFGEKKENKETMTKSESESNKIMFRYHSFGSFATC